MSPVLGVYRIARLRGRAETAPPAHGPATRGGEMHAAGPKAGVALVAAPGAACWQRGRAWALDPVALP